MALDILTYHFPDRRYPSKLDEDAFAFNNQAVCVADGITRDPLDIPDFTGLEMEQILAAYPNPSPAAAAAELACKTFVESAAQPEAAMQAANAAIQKLNKDLRVDYLVDDFAACTAAGGVIANNQISWAAIGDCQLTIFDKNGTEVFTSPNGIKDWADYERAHKGDWNTPEYRKLVRNRYRNNPNEPVAYGALTGEEAAAHYIKSGKISVQPGSMAIFYSDGFGHHLEHPDFYKFINSKDFEKWDQKLTASDPKYAHERTLLAIKF